MVDINLAFSKGRIIEKCKRYLRLNDIKTLFELLWINTGIKEETEVFEKITEQIFINFDCGCYVSTNISEEELDLRLKNVLRNVLERLLFKEKLLSWPLTVHIEVTKRCNASCVMCGRLFSSTKKSQYRHKEVEYKDMPFKIFKKVIQFFPHIHTLGLFGWGEPLVNKSFIQMLEFVKKYKVMTVFTTNGMLLDEKFVEKLKENNFVKEIGISFDGVNEQTFEQIRKGVKFRGVVNNIKRINIMKQVNKRILPHLSFSFVAMRRNIEELPALIDLAADLQIKTINVIYLTVHGDSIREESLFYHQDLANKVFIQAKEKAASIGISLNLPELFKENYKTNNGGQNLFKNKYRCFDPWSLVMIDNDGDVKPCCNYEGALGNLNGEKFIDIWNNKKYQNIRKSFKTKQNIGCDTCVKYADVNAESTHIHLV